MTNTKTVIIRAWLKIEMIFTFGGPHFETLGPLEPPWHIRYETKNDLSPFNPETSLCNAARRYYLGLIGITTTGTLKFLRAFSVTLAKAKGPLCLWVVITTMSTWFFSVKSKTNNRENDSLLRTVTKIVLSCLFDNSSPWQHVA